MRNRESSLTTFLSCAAAASEFAKECRGSTLGHRMVYAAGCNQIGQNEGHVNGDQHLTKEKLLKFLERLGASAGAPGACFITGGGTALLLGWRETTVDIGLKFDPEPAGVFDAIPGLKRALHINVELAAPSDFLPPLSQWRERCKFIGKYGQLEVYHYDFLSQALSKLERGHAKDLLDVREMLRRRLVQPEELLASSPHGGEAAAQFTRHILVRLGAQKRILLRTPRAVRSGGGNSQPYAAGRDGRPVPADALGDPCVRGGAQEPLLALFHLPDCALGAAGQIGIRRAPKLLQSAARHGALGRVLFFIPVTTSVTLDLLRTGKSLVAYTGCRRACWTPAGR